MELKIFLYERSQHIHVTKVPSLIQTISFFIRKRKSQIKATSHIPAETHELYYNYFIQTTDISHSKIRFNNSYISLLTVTGISEPTLLKF